MHAVRCARLFVIGAILLVEGAGECDGGTSDCLRCHSAQRQGIDRDGAPVGLNFDTLEEIRTDAAAIFEVAADSNTLMPAAGVAPSHEDRVLLGDWLACGAH